jgi:hypothetical protein
MPCPAIACLRRGLTGPRFRFRRSLSSLREIYPVAPGGRGPAPLARVGAPVPRVQRGAAVRAHLVEQLPRSLQAGTMQTNNIIAEGDLKIWIRGRTQSFDSLGACRPEGDSLLCKGSLSASEADTCKFERDGIHQCRIREATLQSGSFQVVRKPEGVLVTIRKRLELVPAADDSGPFLYFSPTNAENRAFLLERASGVCK